jgi:hypothetical protein
MVKVIEIPIPAADRWLAARLFEPRPARNAETGNRLYAGLIFVHGLKGSQRAYTECAETVSLELNLTCLTFDLTRFRE